VLIDPRADLPLLDALNAQLRPLRLLAAEAGTSGAAWLSRRLRRRQVGRDLRELIQCRLEILHDLGCNDLRRRQGLLSLAICRGTRFGDYVGTAYESSKSYITTIDPSAENWAQGDPEVVCLLNLEDLTQITNSARDSRE